MINISRLKMIEFYEEEASEIKKELDRLRQQKRIKEIRQAELRRYLVGITKINGTLLRINELQQEIEVLGRQIMYLDEKIYELYLRRQKFLRLIEKEQKSLHII